MKPVRQGAFIVYVENTAIENHTKTSTNGTILHHVSADGVVPPFERWEMPPVAGEIVD